MVRLNQQTFINGTAKYAFARLVFSLVMLSIFDLFIWRTEFERVYREFMDNQERLGNWRPYHEPELLIGLTISQVLWQQLMFMILTLLITTTGNNLSNRDFEDWVQDMNRRRWFYRIGISLIFIFFGWIVYQEIFLHPFSFYRDTRRMKSNF